MRQPTQRTLVAVLLVLGIGLMGAGASLFLVLDSLAKQRTATASAVSALGRAGDRIDALTTKVTQNEEYIAALQDQVRRLCAGHANCAPVSRTVVLNRIQEEESGGATSPTPVPSRTPRPSPTPSPTRSPRPKPTPTPSPSSCLLPSPAPCPIPHVTLLPGRRVGSSRVSQGRQERPLVHTVVGHPTKGQDL